MRILTKRTHNPLEADDMMLCGKRRLKPATTKTADGKNLPALGPAAGGIPRTGQARVQRQKGTITYEADDWQGARGRVEFAFRREGNWLDCVRPDTAAVGERQHEN